MDVHDGPNYRPDGGRGEAPVDENRLEELVTVNGWTLYVGSETGDGEWFPAGEFPRPSLAGREATRAEVELAQRLRDAEEGPR